ncbi:trypsin-1-like [Macrobrachium rosenbergii]|uniref:trypsin-1-like n=1 Tax=Macrobrachium rosenbergii TaxID=79674 RepID=UPI0034D7B63F
MDVCANLINNGKSYRYEWKDNDIALLKLDQPIEFDDTMQPICMPSSHDYEPPEKEVVATGWGVTAENGKPSNILQEVALTLKSPNDCKKLNDNAPKTFTLTDNMICTYTQGKDACQGDSGGPLITRSTDNRWVLLGIVSFGYGCAEPNVPGFYTKVVNYLDWIKNVTKPDEC